jgi:SAM-dependent methyltransferase
MSLLATETQTYADMWQAVDSYKDHSPGEAMLPIFLDIVGPDRGHVLDAGTGSGKGALALRHAGFDVLAIDLTDAGLVPEAGPESRTSVPFRSACLWQPLPVTAADGVDWVYCTDVLEHVPPQFTMLAIDQMLRVARRGVFLSVSLVPDHFGVWIGKALHQTVQSFVWWRDSIAELGRVTDARDLLASATFYVEPRR